MTMELVPATDTVSLPITVEEAVRQWNDYQLLTQKLLNDTDYQRIGQKTFKKKSAWRKYARAFNISDRVVSEEIVRSEDGFPVFARIRVEASHPNGRTAEADHECHVSERCCIAASGLPCEKSGWRGHYCCARGCTGRAHWSHAGDIPATALTRAKNRAIADLIGAGEVSAEEAGEQLYDDVVEQKPRAPRWTAQRQPASPPVVTIDAEPLVLGDISEETKRAVEAAYRKCAAGRPTEFKPEVIPVLRERWPHCFTPAANLIKLLSENEGKAIIEWLTEQTPLSEEDYLPPEPA